MTIKQEYKKVLKAAQQRRLYYQKKYGVELPEVMKTKKPTRASIRRLSNLYRGGINVVKKRIKKPVGVPVPPKPEPSQEPIGIDVVILGRLQEIIDEAYFEAGGVDGSGAITYQQEWLWWKTHEADKIVLESGKTWDDVEAKFPKLDEELIRYLYDSDNRRNNRYKEFLDKLKEIVLGIKVVSEVVYDFDEDEV